jgi:hypothetical protein
MNLIASHQSYEYPSGAFEVRDMDNFSDAWIRATNPVEVEP